MFCHNCGSKLPEDAAFCTLCGAPVSSAGTPPEESVTGPSDEYNEYKEPITSNNNPSENEFVPPVYYTAPPVNNAEPPKKKKGKAGKVIGILFGIFAGLGLLGGILIAAVLLFVFVILPGLSADSTVVLAPETTISFEEGTMAEEASTEAIAYNDELYYDPIGFFRYDEKSYYYVTTSPNADFYIYSDFNSYEYYYDFLTPGSLVYVYGYVDNWACIRFNEAESGYGWCQLDSLRKTDDVPESKFEDPIHYFADQPDKYYRVSGTNYEGLNLRTEPNTECQVICVLQESEILLVYGIEDGWAYVSTADPRTQSDIFGWVTTEYIVFSH